MNRKLGLIAAATLATTFGLSSIASAETGSFTNQNGNESRTWTLTGVPTCTTPATGTWSVAWTLVLSMDDGAGTTITSKTSDTGTTAGFPNIAPGAFPAYDSVGTTAGLTAASVTLNVGYTLVPDGVPKYLDTNNNNIQDPTEPDIYDNFPAGAKIVPGSGFDPQVAMALVARPAGCVATVTVPTTPTVPTTVKVTAAPTAATTVAASVAAATALPATGSHTNRLAVLAALAVMAGAGFFTAAKPMSARRRNAG